MIPRHLVHIVPSHGQLAPELRDNLQAQSRANPGWEHLVFTDADALAFIEAQFERRYLDALNRIDPAYGPARSDLMRYLIMYQLGGVYLDNKSGTSKPLDAIIRPDDEFIVSQWHRASEDPNSLYGLHPELAHIELANVPAGEFQNWVIITRPKHPFLAAVIETVVQNIEHYSVRRFGVGKPGVLRLTGPIAYTLAIVPLLEQHTFRRVHYIEAGLVYAASGDYKRHELLTDLHYSRLLHPIVRPSAHAPALARHKHAVCRAVLILVARIRHWNRHRLARRGRDRQVSA
jgi:hypothetical protein